MARKLHALAFAALFAAGCIHRAPEPAVHPDGPHISWEIASDGPTHSSEKHACTSVERIPCELQSGTAEEPLEGEFTIYLHPAVEETTYTGVVELGYLGIAVTKPARLDVNQKVPPRRVSNVPIQANISSRLVAPPGSYRVSMKIVATTGGKSTTIEDAVTVTIRPPGYKP